MPVTLVPYTRATKAADRPEETFIFSACSASVTHGGLTALTEHQTTPVLLLLLRASSRPACTHGDILITHSNHMARKVADVGSCDHSKPQAAQWAETDQEILPLLHVSALGYNLIVLLTVDWTGSM